MAGSETYIPACSNDCLCLPPHYVVPAILKDAIKVTSENIEKELENTLKMVFQFTGTLYMYVQLMPYSHCTASYMYMVIREDICS